MANVRLILLLVCVSFAVPVLASSPEDDRLALLHYYQNRFPDIPVQEFANGLYAFDEAAREQWLEMEDFPPYEIAIEEGEDYFNTAFANGKGYADCFENGGIGIKQNFPYFDDDLAEVVTIELEINRCREANGEDALPYAKGELAAVSAYMSYTSRDNTITIQVPEDNPGAIAAYEAGKEFYYTRRGQLNFACASCHLQSAGLSLRADRLSMTVGQTTHFPVYRSAWGDIGTIHKRFAECNIQVRARPFKAQSIELRNLEYFLSYMSNGLQLNGPASRR